jgi:hypothetical protein
LEKKEERKTTSGAEETTTKLCRVTICLKVNFIAYFKRGALAIVDLMSTIDLLGNILCILDLNQLKFI